MKFLIRSNHRTLSKHSDLYDFLSPGEWKIIRDLIKTGKTELDFFDNKIVELIQPVKGNLKLGN